MSSLKVLQNRVLKIIFGFGSSQHPTEELYSVKISPLYLNNAFQLMFYKYKIINGFLDTTRYETRTLTPTTSIMVRIILTKALNLNNGIDITIRNERRISVFRSLLIDFLWHRRVQYLVI
jgi:hypothetical protein